MSKQTWFNLRASGTTLTIDILDVIATWGVSAKDFLAQVRSAGTFTAITLNINSPGGDVLEGFTIYDGLRALGIDITVNIIGTAASMAGVIALAGKHRRIAENGQIMIHRVTSGASGNADELDAAAKITQQFEDRIVAIYVESTGKDEAQIRNWMKTSQGTWFIGQAAIDAGFATALIPSKAAAFKNEWAHLFTMLPAALFDTGAPSTAPRASNSTPMNKLIIALASLAGIAVKGDETDDQLEAAIKAHKPAGQKFEMNLDDPETKKLFDTAVSAGITEAMKPVTAEMTSLRALITNGAAGAAGGISPVPAPTPKPQGGSIQDQFEAITDPAERTRFYNKHRSELSKPSSYFKAA